MQRLLTVIALIGTTGFATAEDLGPTTLTTSQISLGDQSSLNEIIQPGASVQAVGASSILNGPRSGNISSEFAVIEDDTAAEITGPGRGTINQSILNAVNILLASGSVIDSAEQTMLGSQTARNVIDTGSGPARVATEQTGENLANIIIADEVGSVSQAFGPGARQAVGNELTAGAASSVVGVNQTGRNTANVVLATVSIGSGEQLFPADTSQVVENLVTLDRAAQLRGNISQSGTNIGNVLIADEVRNVARIFNGDQIVRNTVSALDGQTPRGVDQSGLNIANFVSAKYVEGLTQVSEGRQIVENRLEGVTLEDMSRSVPGYTHSSTNIVNLLDIQSADEPGLGTTVNASQIANQPQRAQSNNGTHSQIGNASSITR